jgi:hypothetical protein
MIRSLGPSRSGEATANVNRSQLAVVRRRAQRAPSFYLDLTREER